MISIKPTKLYSDIEIYQYYLGEFEIDQNIISPLRQEKNPSFAIYRIDGKLRWKDFGKKGSGGNATNLVMELYGLSYKAAKEKIQFDLSGVASFVGLPLPKIKEKKEVVFKIKVIPWTKEALDYWNSYGISVQTLTKFSVYQISHYWIDDTIYSTKFGFAYYFGNGKYKLYFPNGNIRFLGNASCELFQGINELPSSGDKLIITKSMKDLMLLDSINYSSIAVQSETCSPKSLTFTKNWKEVFVFFDNDFTGIESAKNYIEKFGFKSIMIPLETNCKDISDYCKLNGVEKTKELINYLINE